MPINPLHFAGSHESPTSLAEVMSRRPILGTGKQPEALAKLAEQRSIIVRTREQPKVQIQEIKDVPEPVWRVDLPADKRSEMSFIPGKTAQREKPETFLSAIDEAIPHSGFKPDWADALYTPRLAPQREIPSMRRLSGRPIEPLCVFGADDRLVFRDASYPWGVIGKVFNSRGGYGSGALVGDRLVVTAAHLVPWGDSPWWMLFVPAFYDGISLHGSGVQSYVSDTEALNLSGQVTGYDWAILRLYTPLGQLLGYFGFNGYSSDWNNQPLWTIAGYPGAVANAQRPSYQNSITIFEVDSDTNGGQELESQTADTTNGDSGGPMFANWNNDPRVVGVVSGCETEAPAGEVNVIASGSGFTNLIAWGRTNWPA